VAQKLLESEDYAYFLNVKFLFKEENRSNSVYWAKAKQKEEEMNSEYYLENLKEKCDNLDIDYSLIYNFSTKILNKQQFNRGYMVMFNEKVNISSHTGN